MAKLFQKTMQCLTGYWATGPILGKELRVAGRQKRYYAIRLLYILSLLGVLVFAWADLLRNFSGVNVSIYLTEVAGQICRMIAVVQFFGAQAAAVFLLCGVIAEETRKRTLGVLLSTPITSFQIIGGKLFSKLLQVWLLLALSLPVYAILRVYGGIPWDFVVQTTVVTLAAVFFAASVTLLVGTFVRRSYTTLIISVIVIALCYAMGTNSWVYYSVRFVPGTDWIIASLNPYHVFQLVFCEFDWPWGIRYVYCFGAATPRTAVPAWFLLPWASAVQSGMILGTSLMFLLIAARRLRKLALKELSKQTNRQRRRFIEVCESLINLLPRISWRRHIRSVRGRAMVWKEMHNSLIRGELLRGRYIYLLLIGAIVITYSLFSLTTVSDVEGVLAMVIICLTAGAAMVTSIAAASSITKEKETASWQILLTTPLSDSEILWGKVVGVFRRSAIIWSILLLLLTILSYVGICHYWSVPMTGIVAFGITAFLAGTGIYLSVRFRSTPRAVMTLLLIASILWVMPPVLGEMIPYSYRYDLFDFMEAAHPSAQILRVMESPDAYHYPYYGLGVFLESAFFVVLNAVCYAAVGATFAWRAKVNLRRKIC